MRRRVVVPSVVLGIAVLAGWFFFARPVPPAGQPALIELRPDTLTTFAREFNQASGRTRVVLLLSPT